MLKWLNKQGVESSDGFILQRMHRYYIENDRIMKVAVEPLRDKSEKYYEQIYLSTLQSWEPPFDTQHIGNNDQSRIRANISAALDFMSISHEFINGPHGKGKLKQ